MSVLAERDQYDDVATGYSDFQSLPLGQMEGELVKIGLGDCTGLRVIDIGGGSGVQVRKAIDLGATIVDVVDISPEMMKIGSDIELSLGRQGKINYHVADAAKPMNDLGLQKASYDLVIANWLLDHATSMEDLEGMWQNISQYAKPGARLVGARMADFSAKALDNSVKYGIIFQDLKEIPGGLVYRVICTTEPPFEFEATTMTASFSGSTEMYEKYGFENVQNLDAAATAVAKQDPEFWKKHLDDPFFVVATATKRR